MNRVTETAPERIWLQVGTEAHQCDDDFPPHGDDVTWQHESITECEVEYIRADLARLRIAELEKALKRASASTQTAVKPYPYWVV
jgi:hypothetical protein